MVSPTLNVSNLIGHPDVPAAGTVVKETISRVTRTHQSLNSPTCSNANPDIISAVAARHAAGDQIDAAMIFARTDFVSVL